MMKNINNWRNIILFVVTMITSGCGGAGENDLSGQEILSDEKAISFIQNEITKNPKIVYPRGSGVYGIRGFDLKNIEILKRGKYNNVKNHWPVRARITGHAIIKFGVTRAFLKEEINEFDKLIEVRLSINDFDEWNIKITNIKETPDEIKYLPIIHDKPIIETTKIKRWPYGELKQVTKIPTKNYQVSLLPVEKLNKINKDRNKGDKFRVGWIFDSSDELNSIREVLEKMSKEELINILISPVNLGNYIEILYSGKNDNNIYRTYNFTDEHEKVLDDNNYSSLKKEPVVKNHTITLQTSDLENTQKIKANSLINHNSTKLIFMLQDDYFKVPSLMMKDLITGNTMDFGLLFSLEKCVWHKNNTTLLCAQRSRDGDSIVTIEIDLEGGGSISSGSLFIDKEFDIIDLYIKGSSLFWKDSKTDFIWSKRL